MHFTLWTSHLPHWAWFIIPSTIVGGASIAAAVVLPTLMRRRSFKLLSIVLALLTAVLAALLVLWTIVTGG